MPRHTARVAELLIVERAVHSFRQFSKVKNILPFHFLWAHATLSACCWCGEPNNFNVFLHFLVLLVIFKMLVCRNGGFHSLHPGQHLEIFNFNAILRSLAVAKV